MSWQDIAREFENCEIVDPECLDVMQRMAEEIEKLREQLDDTLNLKHMRSLMISASHYMELLEKRSELISWQEYSRKLREAIEYDCSEESGHGVQPSERLFEARALKAPGEI